MSNGKFEKYAPVIFGFLGVLIGALVTGVFSFYSQSAENSKDLAIETSAGSREIAENHIQAATRYFSAYVMMKALSKDKNAEKLYTNEIQELIEATGDLAFRSSPATALKLMNATAGIVDDSSDNDTAQTKAYVDALISVYFDIAKFRWRATPDAGKDEMMKILLELLALHTNGK